MAYILHALILSALTVVYHKIDVDAVGFDIGVNYGMLGNNLPPAATVVDIFKRYGINRMRLFDPNLAALEALRKSNIVLTLGIRNEDLPNLASSQNATNTWFAKYVDPYLNDIVISTITVGNEIIPTRYAAFILPVMVNLQNIIDGKGLAGIKVSTVVSSGTLQTSFPPSQGEFSGEATGTMIEVLQFLSDQGSPLLINVYPYFAVEKDPVNIRLDYALFTATDAVVQDGKLSYYNMFDAIVDAFFSAMEKLGYNDVQVVVSETGWPNCGNGNLTTPHLAYTYNWHFVRRIQNFGTPKRPNTYIEGFIFAMFNENQKPAGVERCFGLMYPNMQPIYPL